MCDRVAFVVAIAASRVQVSLASASAVPPGVAVRRCLVVAAVAARSFVA